MRARPVVAAALALAALPAGCGGADKSGGGASAARQPRPKASPVEAVVHVEARYANRNHQSTGFIIDAGRGWVLASDHGVEAASSIIVTAHDGSVMHAELIARASCHDLALLELHSAPPGLASLKLGDSRGVTVGDRLTTYAYALPSATSGDAELLYSHGTVAATNVKAVLHRLLPAMAPLIAHQVPLGATGSGSPLVDARGQAVGINTLVGKQHGTTQGLNYALTSSFVSRLLARLHRGPAGLAGWRDEQRCRNAIKAIAGVPGARPAPRDRHTHGHGHGHHHAHRRRST